jgi:hypothetical protein
VVVDSSDVRDEESSTAVVVEWFHTFVGAEKDSFRTCEVGAWGSSHTVGEESIHMAEAA